MQLIQIDSVEPEPFQAFVDTSFKVFRSTIRDPLSWPGSGIAALRRNDKAFRVRVKRFGNQQFACVRTIGRSEEHTSELQSQSNLVCRLLLEKKKRQHMSDVEVDMSLRYTNIVDVQ